MTYEQAKTSLLLHGTGVVDAEGNRRWLDDGFLRGLRPFKGVFERNFHLVMEALFVAGETIHLAPAVDRDLVESLWTMCHSAYNWGVRNDGMLRRSNVLELEEIIRLGTWVDIIERTTWALLRGTPPHREVDRYAQYVVDFQAWDNIDFFLPYMQRAMLEITTADQSEDDPALLAEAFGKVGARAGFVLPDLRHALTLTYNSYKPAEKCTEDVRGYIRRAIDAIEGRCVMTEDRFWDIIANTCKSDARLSEQWDQLLRAALARFAPDEIIEWNHIFDRLAAQAYTVDLWGAAYTINGGASDDGFYYFRCWLIGMGRDVYYSALSSPDNLADVVTPGLDAEAEIYAAAHFAWIEATGKTYSDPYPARNEDAKLKGVDWNFEDMDEVKRRFPRLSALLLSDA